MEVFPMWKQKKSFNTEIESCAGKITFNEVAKYMDLRKYSISCAKKVNIVLFKL